MQSILQAHYGYLCLVFGAITTPLLLYVVQWWALVMMVVVGILMACYVIRRRTLISAEVIDFDLS